MLMRRIEAALARAGAAAGLYGLAGLVLLGAAGFGVAAFYIWIDGITWHPASPALWTALLLTVIGRAGDGGGESRSAGAEGTCARACIVVRSTGRRHTRRCGCCGHDRPRFADDPSQSG